MTSFRLPHDQLIKKALENPLVAREFFEEHLPKNVKKLLDINSLKLEKESFIEQSLKNSISDVLFSAKFDGQDGYIFLLLEHQSKPDYWMSFRLFNYMINIISKYLAEHPKTKKLPLVYPLVFYNGKQKYNVPRNLWDLFANPKLAKEFWINDYQLINVHEIPDDELKKRLWAGTLQFFMKHIWERDMLKRWQEIASILPELTAIEVGYDHIKLLLAYSLTNMQEIDTIELKNLLKTTLGAQQGEEFMASIAQKWYQEGKYEGKAEGKAEGKVEGKVEVAKNMLRAGITIDTIAKTTGLTKEQIQTLDRF